MSIADVTARISELQSQLALLAPRPTASGAAGGAAFAGALRTFGADTPSTGAAVGASEQAVVDQAKQYLGVPYVWGGTDPDKGLDCSGLVQLVYKNLGIDLPRVSYQQATAGRPVDGMANVRPGDILAFNSPVSHVGIYLGGGKMIEAPRPGTSVRISDVYETPVAIRRVLPDTPAVAGAAALPASTPYASLFTSASARYGVDATLLAAVAKQESGFNPRAVSHAGAQGLMQLMPGTAKGLGVTDAFDPAQAVDGAARLLQGLLGQFGRTDLALAAYNAGPGAVTRYDGIPPYPETQNYVRSVLGIQNGMAG